ncbi:pseudouridine synthase [Bradyrhizobium erythrophlei]|jgi:23S rRNA pseudouridine2605 synthase|uniref:Pseudouridine synthase n=1 Tax=Bradyrhizobium erythrophlei TaxID=1437360 RepID=A0A1M5WX18_9BRAD|nr:pseudouridine synthase [Bradyrhizobium erythrophlei]SHH91868.1 23S rRNA pseudouridine2605 synthase [Bradyrhizobium erythrophlei]
MPRDNDKNNDSRGRRDRPSGGKGRSGAARGPDKKFAKRGFAGKSEGEKRPYAGKSDGARSYGKKPYSGSGKPYAGKREGRSDDRGGEKRPYTPRSDRPNFTPRGDRDDTRPAARFSDRKFGDKKPYAPREGGGEKRPYTPRGEGFRKDGDRPRGDRPYSARPPRDGDRPRGDRPERKFGGDKKFSRGAPDRGPRKDFGSRPDRGADRGESKPWQKRDASSPDHAGRNSRPPRDGARNFDKPRFDKPRYDKPREDRGGERPRFSRPREDRPHGDRPQGDGPFRERPKFDRPREDRPKFERPRRDRDSGPGEGGSSWQEHPRSDHRSFDRNADRPRRDNEDDSKVFAKRPAFGGRGAYRERTPDFEKRAARPPREKKSGERIAKVVSRAGLASRRDAEEWIVQGRVTVNGRVINSPALDVTVNDVITVDGKPLPPRERTRLFMFHKPRGLMTTHADPEGRPTVFDNLPEGLPRLISIGRLDFNTEGLLLLTNDGGLARALELPDTGWLRRYRVRAHGEVTQAQLDELKKGVEVDGVKYGSIDATLERDQGANVWLVFAIREGKNREVRNVMAHLGLEVNRLIRVSYGPFQLGELGEGQVEEVKTRVLREQLGEKIAALAGADFNRPMPGEPQGESADAAAGAPGGKKPFKPAGKSGLIADRKGRRVLVQRTGSEEARARNEAEAAGYGPPRRPQRGYHGKRDLKPRDE